MKIDHASVNEIMLLKNQRTELAVETNLNKAYYMLENLHFEEIRIARKQSRKNPIPTKDNLKTSKIFFLYYHFFVLEFQVLESSGFSVVSKELKRI